MSEQRLDWGTSAKPSRITIPEHANPLARLMFAEMRRQNITYAELEWRSGILTSSIKSWRKEKNPGLISIEAVLGALGYTLVPVPNPDSLPQPIRDLIEEARLHFTSDEETFGALLAAAAAWPEFAHEQLDDAKRRLAQRRAESEGETIQ